MANGNWDSEWVCAGDGLIKISIPQKEKRRISMRGILGGLILIVWVAKLLSLVPREKKDEPK